MAERALFLWNNEYIVSLIAKGRDVILPVLYPALEANTTKHWNRCHLSSYCILSIHLYVGVSLCVGGGA